jgi:hypothetical protein
VLPHSFPFGGMENPRLTFATPTVLAGDRSLVSLIAHELAHSWSGNLVTNVTLDDFRVNEGVTTYIESRLMEELLGPEYADMLRQLGRRISRGRLRSWATPHPIRDCTSTFRPQPGRRDDGHRLRERRRVSADRRIDRLTREARRVPAPVLRRARVRADDIGGLPRVHEPGAVRER